MKLLTNSNSLHKVNMKKKIKPKKIINTILIFLLLVTAGGFIYEKISYSKEIGELKTKTKYATLHGNKIHYTLSGKGKYTVVFESEMGYTSYEWEKVIKNMPKNLEVKTFTYDRSGYGYSDKTDYQNPEKQARDLHLFFRKIGLEGPYILVGDGYGSLVMSNFAKIYPDDVAGMILISPINENKMKSPEFIKAVSKGKTSKKVEQLGSYVGLTRVLDNLGLVDYPQGLLDKVSDVYAEDIKAHRVANNYATAIWNETKVLIDGDSTSQHQGMLGNKPLAILVNENRNAESQKELEMLSKEDVTVVQELKPQGDVIPLEYYESIHDALKFVTKQSEMQNAANN